MTASDDSDLRERFAVLRHEDAAGAPPLARVLRGRAARPDARPFRWIPVAVLGTAAVLTTVVLVNTPRRAELSIDEAIAEAQSIESWTAPTDEWLTLSGLEIPNSVPSLTFSSVALPEVSTAATTQGEIR